MNAITQGVALHIMRVSLSERDATYYAPVLAHLTGVSIDKVDRNTEQVGRVILFDVHPYRQIDPPLVYTDHGVKALVPYYKLWNAGVMAQSRGDVLFFPLRRMRKAIEHFKANSTLEQDEINFAIYGMLKFQNEILMR